MAGVEASCYSMGLRRKSLMHELFWHCPQHFGQRLCGYTVGRLEEPRNQMKNSNILGGVGWRQLCVPASRDASSLWLVRAVTVV